MAPATRSAIHGILGTADQGSQFSFFRAPIG